jgi:hypothetical protein
LDEFIHKIFFQKFYLSGCAASAKMLKGSIRLKPRRKLAEEAKGSCPEIRMDFSRLYIFVYLCHAA